MKKIMLILLLFIANIILLSANEELDYGKSANTFIQLLEEGKFTDASLMCDSMMKVKLPSTQLESIWTNLKKQVGNTVKIEQAKVNPIDKYVEVIKVIQLEKIALDAKIYYTKGSNLISGFFLAEHKSDFSFPPPPYTSADKFSETNVQFGVDGYKLDGKLIMPKGDGPFPAVILVHGSGPNDMDETIGKTKPFRDIAYGLASNGIAVLRYNKRTFQYGYKIANDSLFSVYEETIADAIEALKFLTKDKLINSKKIFILGHSLGGMMLPRIAPLTPTAAGYISLAGSLRNFGEIVPKQYEYIFSLDGAIDSSEKVELEKIQKQINYTYSKKLKINSPKDSVLFTTYPYYWMEFNKYDMKKAAKQIEKPLYILQGARDYQVTRDDYKVWLNTMSGKKNVEFKLYPTLNHLFISGNGPSTPSDYDKESYVDFELIIDLSNWIKKH